MTIKIPGLARLLLCTGLALAAAPARAQGDALDEPATASALASRSLLMDLDRVGPRLVAVGEHGHVLISDDGAASWSQAEVPVRVTLTASYFIDERLGWAVGHDGVVLRTRDGGRNWKKVLDGYRANDLMLARAQARVTDLESALETAVEDRRDELESRLDDARYLHEDAEAFKAEGPSRPFLDLWFKDAKEGYVVGAFGLILRTLDGGDHWSAWFDRLDNPQSLHLNAIRRVGDDLYIAAEAGNLFRSADNGESWERLDSPYDGSFFGVIGDRHGGIIAYGLRGHAYRSEDRGDSWSAIATETDASLFGATLLDDGSVVLAGAAGTTVVIDADGQGALNGQTRLRLPLSALVGNGDGALLMVGEGGIQTLSLVAGNP